MRSQHRGLNDGVHRALSEELLGHLVLAVSGEDSSLGSRKDCAHPLWHWRRLLLCILYNL